MHKIFVKTKCVVSFNVPFVSRPKKRVTLCPRKRAHVEYLKKKFIMMVCKENAINPSRPHRRQCVNTDKKSHNLHLKILSSHKLHI